MLTARCSATVPIFLSVFLRTSDGSRVCCTSACCTSNSHTAFFPSRVRLRAHGISRCAFIVSSYACSTLSAHRESSPATLTASFFFAACFLIRWWVGWDHVQSTDHGVNTVRALCSTNFGSIEGAPSQTSSVSNQVRHLLSVQTGETTVLCSASLEVLTTPTPSFFFLHTHRHTFVHAAHRDLRTCACSII
jgi:hypothetical protein